MEGSTTKPAAQPGQQREWSTVEWMDQSLGKYVSIKKLVDILCTRARNEKIRNEEGNPIKKSDLQIVTRNDRCYFRRPTTIVLTDDEIEECQEAGKAEKAAAER